MTASTTRLILAYAAMCVIWGSTWMAIKIGLEGAPPLTSIAVRMVIATAVVFAIVRLWRIPIPRDARFVRLGLFLGLFHIVFPYSLVYYGEQRIPSGQAAVLYATLPLMVAVLARFVLGDALTARKLFGIATGIAGVAVIFSDSLSGPAGAGGDARAAGVALVLGSVFASSVGSVATKRWSRGYHPVASLLIPFATGAVVAACGALLFEDASPLRFDTTTWLSIVYLAVAGSVSAFALFFFVIQHLDVTLVSYQTFIIPIIAVLIGVAFGETISPRVGAGAALILAGIALATFWSNPRAGRRPGPP
ncbi:MAG TPA: EamA family transporter [Candidatus Krumholzibacteria bacterium]|nr:EamA family transporter [Candidatus Krumholzibacteria bacterium]